MIDYYRDQLNRLGDRGLETPKVKLWLQGNETKVLDLNSDSLPVVIEWLEKILKEIKEYYHD